MKTIVVLFCLVFIVQAKPAPPTIDLSTPEKAVRSFLTMYSAGELRQAGRCVEGFQPTPQIDEFDRDMKKYKMLMSGPPVIKDIVVQIDGDTATAKVSFGPLVQKGMSEVEQISLKRTGQDWKIVPLDQIGLIKMSQEMQSRTAHDFPLITMMSSTLDKFPALYAMRESARVRSCSDNMKQIAVGALMLTQDYDEVFKIKKENFMVKILSYHKNKEMFHCPSDAQGAISYAFNGNLSGVSIAAVKDPTKTVLFYEGKNGLLNFRHRGRAAVAFVDSHVEMLDAAGAKKLRWKP